MPNIGGPELILIVLVVLIVFGAGKLPDVFGQVGRGLRQFRETASGEEKPAPAATASGAAPAPGTTIYCRNCGRPNPTDAKFCSNCGQAL